MGEEGGGRSGGISRDLLKLKQQAMAYYQENDVPRKLEELLNSTFYLQPADVYGHLANYFSKLAKPPSICKIVGKTILDGLGLPTLQVEISCTIQNFPKYICSVAIPTHSEVVENALPEMVDADEAERQQAVSKAVRWINQFITEELWGLIPSNQAEVDRRLRIFFEHKVQADKDRKELERSQEEPVPMTLPVILPPPPPPPSKKKGQKAGRRDTLLEKPIFPPEPPEPVLHGSMAIGAVSLAVAKTSATLAGTPLYLTLALLKHDQEQPSTFSMPLLMGSVLSCGKSSPGKLHLMKEVMCIPSPGLTTKQGIELLLEIQKQVNRAMETLPPPKPETKKGHNGGKRSQPPITGRASHLGCLTINYDTIEQPLLLIQGICSNLGLELGVNFHLAINCAGHELMDYSKGKYEVMVGTYKSAAEMVELYVDLINKYPSIIALIDPFRKEDSEQWDSLYAAVASRCYLIAGAASRSVSRLLEDRNISLLKYHGLIIKHTNQTTMSDLVEITHLINGKKHLAVFGSTDSESSDDSLVDLAVGLGARFIKLGGLSRGERMTKYNRLLAIEEELIQSGAWEDATTTTAEETLEPLDSIFPTEVIEESAKT
ncbi:similar to enolase (46.6 kD) (2J223) (predicted) [Rattus norvegicus]|uniref:Enolase 4 n=1 Tax=Rattus norvegicus TaxID=10116 RepID=A6JI77_RAT|nr:enolase 4 [Rattus norvegicus]EDL94551.1 similar to enolase (46.6 kD) (2J223) (predicted) [Rattus norvegicus]|eukprot:NP_001127977.1 enolase 4 [Rattus norvegicus]